MLYCIALAVVLPKQKIVYLSVSIVVVIVLYHTYIIQLQTFVEVNMSFY